MRVQRVIMPESGRESWTLLGDDLAPVEPVERFLAFLASVSVIWTRRDGHLPELTAAA